MKFFTLSALVLVLSVGCLYMGCTSLTDGMADVQKAFPQCEIFAVDSTTFILRNKEGEVFYVVPYWIVTDKQKPNSYRITKAFTAKFNPISNPENK